VRGKGIRKSFGGSGRLPLPFGLRRLYGQGNVDRTTLSSEGFDVKHGGTVSQLPSNPADRSGHGNDVME